MHYMCLGFSGFFLWKIQVFVEIFSGNITSVSAIILFYEW